MMLDYKKQSRALTSAAGSRDQVSTVPPRMTQLDAPVVDHLPQAASLHEAGETVRTNLP